MLRNDFCCYIKEVKELEDLMQLLSNFGFPIVAFLICCYALKYSFDKSLEQNAKNVEALAKLTEAINNNTVTLTELVKEVERCDKD